MSEAFEQNRENQRLSEEEALIAAEAEKPVRDLAREEGIDEKTKEVFDARAEQRGEIALGKHREKERERAGLLNPEFARLRQELEETSDQLRELLRGNDEYGSQIVNYHLDADRNLKGIAINGLKEGLGPLGKKLQREAELYWKFHPHREGFDDFIMDVYSIDPEVKSIIDEGVRLCERLKALDGQIEEFKEGKRRQYQNTSAINVFLERIGWPHRVPEGIDLQKLEKSASELKNGDHESVLKLGLQLVRIIRVFKGLEVDKDRLEDLGPDLDPISYQLRRILAVLEGRWDDWKVGGKSFHMELADDAVSQLEYTNKIYKVKEETKQES
ncbi:MAG: hypothetical protein V2A55_00410 [Candidatus Jorgensenbacteria bacterium]